METTFQIPTPTIALLAPLAPTLGQQQNAAALQALAAEAASAPIAQPARFSFGPTLMAARNQRLHLFSKSGGVGLGEPDRIGCPYCRHRTYLVRVRPLGNLLSYDGHCTTCGTKGRQLKEHSWHN